MTFRSTMVATIGLVAVVSVGGVAAGCGGSKLAKKAAREGVTVEAPTSSGTSSAAGAFAPGALSDAAQQLEEKIGYPPKALDVTLTPAMITFTVQDKAKPDEANAYLWQGGSIDGPTPVRLSGSGTLGENVFALSEVNLDAVPELVAAGEATKLEGGQVTTIIIQRNLPFSQEVRWLVNVSGTRKTVQLRANAKGKVTETVGG